MSYGGYSDKRGNDFERRWVLRQLVLLTNPSSCIQSLEWEVAGPDEVGADLWISRKDGIRECHQCKKEPAGKASWSINDLGRMGIFSDLKFQLRRDRHLYRLVSGARAPDFEDLLDQAKNSRDAESFWRDQASGHRRLEPAFCQFCKFLELDPGQEADRATAWELLRRSRFTLYRDDLASAETLAAMLRVVGNPRTAVQALESWLGGKYRQLITIEEVAAELASHDLNLFWGDTEPPTQFHVQVTKPEILETVQRHQRRFSNALQHNLAGGHLIPRQATQEVLKHLFEHQSRIVVVHGLAGVGKSGVLLELTWELEERGTRFLPLRLDQLELRGSPERFGEELGFPAGPGQSLALVLEKEEEGILILDQLDALRWTGAHSREAWDVCRELIEQALLSSSKLKVVVCCRTFDLDHDPQFRGWESQTRNQDGVNLRKVKVDELTEEQVQAAVQRASADDEETRELDAQEIQLLRLVFHLQIWLEIQQGLEGRAPIHSRRTLLDEFWANRRGHLKKAGISPHRLDQIEERLLKAMDGGAQLSTSLSALRLSTEERGAYQSLQILQVQPGTRRVSFCHQNYLDYLVAVRLAEEVQQGRGDLVTWLGPKDQQNLFRREQLRLVLEEFRERNPRTYLVELRRLVEAGEQVRFHLRLLALQFLSQQDRPLPGEKDLVLELLEAPSWREHVLSSVVWNHVPWFEVLDDAGCFESWLAGDDERLRDLTLRFLRFFARWKGSRAAALLRPYLDKDEDWNARIANHLPLEPAQDSDELFELRLDLAKRGTYLGDHIDWQALAQEHPHRLPKLAEQLILALAEEISDGQGERLRPGRRGELDWGGLNEVTAAMIPSDEWSHCWSSLTAAVLAVAKARRHPLDRLLETHDSLFETVAPVLDFLKRLAGTMMDEDWREFVALRDDLPEEGQRGEIIFLHCLSAGPRQEELANWALEWLMADPWRTRLSFTSGDGRWRLSGQLIERFAPSCSDAVYERLEGWLLSYLEPDLVELYRFRHGQRDQGARSWIHSSVNENNSFGRTPRALLSKLPPDRASPAVARRLGELTRKFGPPSSSDHAEGSRSFGGRVTSPLPEETAQRMSDEAWLQLISCQRSADGRSRVRWAGNRFQQASPEHFAQDLQAATMHEPERFGNLLVTRWPADAHPVFVRAILSGLAESGRSSGASQNAERPSHELLEQILAMPLVKTLTQAEDDREMGQAICRIFRRYPEYPWSDTALSLLVWLAQHHDDPAPGYFPIGEPSEEAESLEHLENNALNVTRGSCGFTIRALLFQQPELIEKLGGAVEHLSQDPHPAVRVGALAACLPLLKIDRDLGVDYFLQSVEGPDTLLATREAREFLSHAHRTHLDRLLPTIERMLASKLSRVKTSGASVVAAAFLINRKLPGQFEECMNGPEEHRMGVAEVAAALMEREEYNEDAKRTMLRLADDPSDEVAPIVARSFRHLDLEEIEADPEAWQRFANSRAFTREPSPLLHALKNQSGDLLPFADCLLAAGAAIIQEPARGEMTLTYQVLPLLLRLYEQAEAEEPEIQRRCLDLWDELLEHRVDSALELTSELDQR